MYVHILHTHMIYDVCIYIYIYTYIHTYIHTYVQRTSYNIIPIRFIYYDISYYIILYGGRNHNMAVQFASGILRWQNVIHMGISISRQTMISAEHTHQRWCCLHRTTYIVRGVKFKGSCCVVVKL